MTRDVTLSLLNDASVSIFGGWLSAAFCGALRTRRGRLIFWCGMALMLIPQGAAYLLWSAEFRLKAYPLIVHLPLVVLLRVLTGRRLWPVISVLCAYLFCQIRRWFALLAAFLLPGGITQRLAELILTLPLLLFLLHFAAPAIRQLIDYPVKTQLQFGLIPALYYGFDYLTRVYTDILSRGEPVAVEFMPFVCCVAYLIFLLYNSAEERRREQSRQIQSNLSIQLAQAVHEIDALRQSQALASQHRHDLRHHMQYLSSCIEDGQRERALDYISQICREIEAQKVRRWCENEAANLILSAFAGRAERAGVAMRVEGGIPAVIHVTDSDLCVLLSNSLENALNACRPLAEAGGSCAVSVQLTFYEQKERLFLQVANPCREEIPFEKGIPVSRRPGHGIGVQSICAIVERYGGVSSFQVQDGQFILRLFL